jgi:hypothetical protein
MSTSYRKPATRKPLKAMAPAEQLKVQIERAKAQNVHVVIVGKVLATGAPCWIVPSQSKALESLHHIVTCAQNGSLVCDCWACQKDNLVCIHRATSPLPPAHKPIMSAMLRAMSPAIMPATSTASCFGRQCDTGARSPWEQYIWQSILL